jgi:hypothetical protein
MRRLFVLGILLFGALALVIGCSDDDETPVGGLSQGDTADLSFQFIDTAIGEDIFSTIGISIDLAFSLMDEMPGANSQFLRENSRTSLGLDQDEEIIITAVLNFEYTESGWFIFEFEAIVVETLENDTTHINGIDSLQFLNNGVLIDTSVVDPDMDELKIRGHAQWSHSDDASGATHHRIDIEAQTSGVDTLMLVNAAANDTVSVSLATDSASCTLDVYNTLAVTNLLVDPEVEDACPESGRLSVASTVNLGCTGGSQNPLDQLDINHTWTITLVFNDNGTVTMTYSDGTTLWTVTRDCNEL